ncbi:MAG TPA: dihydrolipoamide acetyltransferase family protein [Candidatus Latescibacteria bacterium]|jgi:pyruvate dehydrogenase E2 component (dihydrolipoamide acetyltransferase)|nr:dihydrolipoamide acetyltransferase family protein [Candidatus Latescibacterota bacterium]HJP32465.1 dihydrolipoamide acetyltransferase family protein [Candidatus Latescibacterota bacterium]
MAIDVVMPRLGWTMEEGTLVEWLKASGESVQVGDILFTVESDKALNEVEAFDAGALHIPANAPTPGDSVPVGTVLGYLLAEGETPPERVPPPPRIAVKDVAVTAIPASSGAPPATDRGTPAISPRARRLARELGVDWEHLIGTGRTGRISEEDVRAAASAHSTAAETSEAERIPMSPTRQAIAGRLVTSHRDGAPVTLTADLDATALVELRQRARPRLGYNDYLIRFTATALERHPALNSSLHGDDILLHPGIHIGFAVDTEAGLLVPVVRDANRKSVEEIARESASLSGRALRGELARQEMTGGTFTITNLGADGIDAFTPIINPPQSAILGVGRIAQRPAVHEGEVVPRWLAVVSLTFDHRLVDGGPAARFLATLRELVESPVDLVA